MAATIMSFLDGLLLPNPNAGELNIRMINNATTLPSGGSSHTLRDYSVTFIFDPQFHLASSQNAFSFFSTALARYLHIDSLSGIPIAHQMMRFALDFLGGQARHHGLSMAVVLETVQFMQEYVPDYEALDDALFVHMIRSFEAMDPEEVGGTESVWMSERDISRLKKEQFDGEGNGECCCVCLEEFRKGAVITPLSPCSHRFHHQCIVTWLRKNRTCPICRSRCTVA